MVRLLLHLRNASTKKKCLLWVFVGIVTAATSGYLGYRFIGNIALSISAAAAILVALQDNLHKLKAELSEVSKTTRTMSRHLAAEQQSILNISRHLPKIIMPVSGYSMRATNLEKLLDVLHTYRARTIVELGTGISTLLIAEWIKQQGRGRLVTFDHEEVWAVKARQYIVVNGLDEFVDIRIAKLRPRSCMGYNVYWYDLDEMIGDVKEIDLLVVDGPPTDDSGRELSRLPALPVFWEKLSEECVVFVDDALRTGEVQMIEIWKNRFPGLIARRFESLTGACVLTLPTTK